jgi:serine phosphatase RsbU (regulator of sigma subunit)
MRTFADQAALSMQRARLVDELRQKVAALEAAQAALAARERLERELELAREVQQSVLPRVFPTAEGYTFAARNQPAREVGGDFYDVFRVGEERIGIVIGDVSGKGMPAALYMALARSLIFAEALRERSPRMVMANVNRLLRQLGEPRLFVTVCYGVLTPCDGTFVVCRAGHDYPLLLRGGRARQLQGRGTVLGFFDDAELQLSEERETFEPGDRLVLYTDGLTDVLDAAGARYNLEMLEELLCQYGHCGASELIASTFAALAAYQGAAEQFDDMTMLVIEVK